MRGFARLAVLVTLWGCAQGDVAPPDGSNCTGIPGSPESCNGEDDNCDGVVDEGFPNVGLDCIAGEGACAVPGKTVCSLEGGPGGTRCVGDPGLVGPELCGNDVDDDCDGLLDEGFAEHGEPCTVGVGVCERSGKLRCSDDMTTLVCDNPPGAPGEELCGNGADDDCDGTADEGFETLMQPCDGDLDADLCLEGMWLCSGDGLSLLCSDPNDVDLELCNTLDDDCNSATADGAQDAGINLDCDGVDADLCQEGKTVCNSSTGAILCTDPNDPDPDVCDGADNDCNGGTADGAHDTRYGLGCDGVDSDVCTEGVYTACSGGTLQCSDPNNDTTQNDAGNCGDCGIVCSNSHGSTFCNSGACDPSCSFGWQACGLPRDGCQSLRDINQACTTSVRLAGVRGDEGSDVRTASGYGEAYYVVEVTEPSGSSEDPTVRITLDSPPGVNFGLCARCDNCGGAERCNNSGGVDGVDMVEMRADDDFIATDDYDVSIRIYFISADESSCGNWSLTVQGNVDTASGEDICDG